MKRAAPFLFAALLAAPASALASGTPSVSKAESFTEQRIERKYSSWFRDYPDAITSVDCKLRQTKKDERRYKCSWAILLGYDGGLNDETGPSGLT